LAVRLFTVCLMYSPDGNNVYGFMVWWIGVGIERYGRALHDHLQCRHFCFKIYRLATMHNVVVVFVVLVAVVVVVVVA